MRQKLLTEFYSPRTAERDGSACDIRREGVSLRIPVASTMAHNGNGNGNGTAKEDMNAEEEEEGEVQDSHTQPITSRPSVLTDSGLRMLIEARQVAASNVGRTDDDGTSMPPGSPHAPTWPPLLAWGSLSSSSPSSPPSTPSSGEGSEGGDAILSCTYSSFWPSDAFLYSRSDYLAFPLRRDRREALLWEFPSSLVARFPSSSTAAKAPQELSYPFVPHVRKLLELGPKPIQCAPVAKYYHTKAITKGDLDALEFMARDARLHTCEPQLLAGWAPVHAARAIREIGRGGQRLLPLLDRDNPRLLPELPAAISASHAETEWTIESQDEPPLWAKLISYAKDPKRWMHGRIAALATVDLVVVRSVDPLLKGSPRELAQLRLALEGPFLQDPGTKQSQSPGTPQRRSSKLPWLKLWEAYPGYAQYSWADPLLEAAGRAAHDSFPGWESALQLLGDLLGAHSTQHSLTEHLLGTFTWQVVRFTNRPNAARHGPSALEERNILRSFVDLPFPGCFVCDSLPDADAYNSLHAYFTPDFKRLEPDPGVQVNAEEADVKANEEGRAQDMVPWRRAPPRQLPRPSALHALSGPPDAKLLWLCAACDLAACFRCLERCAKCRLLHCAFCFTLDYSADVSACAVCFACSPVMARHARAARLRQLATRSKAPVNPSLGPVPEPPAVPEPPTRAEAPAVAQKPAEGVMPPTGRGEAASKSSDSPVVPRTPPPVLSVTSVDPSADPGIDAYDSSDALEDIHSGPESPPPVLDATAELDPKVAELGNLLERMDRESTLDKVEDELQDVNGEPKEGEWLAAMRDRGVVRRILQLQDFFRKGQKGSRWKATPADLLGDLWPPKGEAGSQGGDRSQPASTEGPPLADMEVSEEDLPALLAAHQSVLDTLPELHMGSKEYLLVCGYVTEIGNIALAQEPPLTEVSKSQYLWAVYTIFPSLQGWIGSSREEWQDTRETGELGPLFKFATKGGVGPLLGLFVRLLENLSAVALKEGDHKKAASLCNLAIESATTAEACPKSYFRRSQALAAMGRKDESAADLRTFRRLQAKGGAGPGGAQAQGTSSAGQEEGSQAQDAALRLATEIVQKQAEIARVEARNRVLEQQLEEQDARAEEGAERERKEKEERDRERAEYERKERERKEQEKKERERKEEERKERERKDRERKEKEKRERERKERERKERERKERERKEQERKEQERREMEKKEQEKRDRERKEQERIEKEKQEQERKDRERREEERQEQEKKAKERREQEQRAKEQKVMDRIVRTREEQQRQRALAQFAETQNGQSVPPDASGKAKQKGPAPPGGPRGTATAAPPAAAAAAAHRAIGSSSGAPAPQGSSSHGQREASGTGAEMTDAQRRRKEQLDRFLQTSSLHTASGSSASRPEPLAASLAATAAAPSSSDLGGASKGEKLEMLTQLVLERNRRQTGDRDALQGASGAPQQPTLAPAAGPPSASALPLNMAAFPAPPATGTLAPFASAPHAASHMPPFPGPPPRGAPAMARVVPGFQGEWGQVAPPPGPPFGVPAGFAPPVAPAPRVMPLPQLPPHLAMQYGQQPVFAQAGALSGAQQAHQQVRPPAFGRGQPGPGRYGPPPGRAPMGRGRGPVSTQPGAAQAPAGGAPWQQAGQGSRGPGAGSAPASSAEQLFPFLFTGPGAGAGVGAGAGGALGASAASGGRGGSWASAVRLQDDTCCVCMDAEPNTQLLPCKHIQTCQQCTLNIISSSAGGSAPACPICREPISNFIEISK